MVANNFQSYKIIHSECFCGNTFVFDYVRIAWETCNEQPPLAFDILGNKTNIFSRLYILIFDFLMYKITLLNYQKLKDIDKIKFNDLNYNFCVTYYSKLIQKILTNNIWKTWIKLSCYYWVGKTWIYFVWFLLPTWDLITWK